MKKLFLLLFFLNHNKTTITFNTNAINFKKNVTINQNCYVSNTAHINNLTALNIINLDGIINAKTLLIGNTQEPSLIFFYGIPIMEEALEKILVINKTSGQIYQSEKNALRTREEITSGQETYNTVATNIIESNTTENITIKNTNTLANSISTLFEAQNINLQGNIIFLDTIASPSDIIIFSKPLKITDSLNCKAFLNSSDIIRISNLLIRTNNGISLDNNILKVETINTNQTSLTTKNLTMRYTPTGTTLTNLPIIENSNYIIENNSNIFQTNTVNNTLTLNINNLKSKEITANNFTFPNINNVETAIIKNLNVMQSKNLDNTYEARINIFLTKENKYSNNLNQDSLKIINNNLLINKIEIARYGVISINNDNNVSQYGTTNITENLIIKDFDFTFSLKVLSTFTHFIVASDQTLPGTETNIAMLSKKTSAHYKNKINKEYKESKDLCRESLVINLLAMIIETYKKLEKKKKNILLIEKKMRELKLLKK